MLEIIIGVLGVLLLGAIAIIVYLLIELSYQKEWRD